MTTLYKTSVSIELTPVGTPEVVVTVGDKTIHRVLYGTEVIEVAASFSAGSLPVTVEMINKAPNDPATAVEITKVTVNGIADHQFIYAGSYTPQYPEPWASQQRAAGNELPPTLPQAYLSWNGVWCLPITVPAYTWIHQTLSLGWIYD